MHNSEDTIITHSMLSELRDRLLSESKQYGVYQIWKNYKLLDTDGSVDELDTKTNVNALTNLIQIVRYAYKKNPILTSLINGYAQRFSLYCGQQQRKLTDDQIEIDSLLNMYQWNTFERMAALPNKEKVDQEQASLIKVNDSFKKIIVVSGNTPLWRNEQGITIMNLYEFLLNENSLDI